MENEREDLFLEIARGNTIDYADVHKFGTNGAIGTTITPVCSSGFYRTPTTAVSLEVVSTSTNDTAAGSGARSVTVEGLDANGVFQKKTTATDGTSAAAISGTWLRVFRMYVSTSGTYATQTASSHAGTITVQVASGGDVWAQIEVDSGLGLGQSQIGAYTVPKGKEAYLCTNQFSIDSNKTVNLYFFKRDNILDTTAPYEPMRLQSVYEGLTGNNSFQHKTYEKYDELTDIGYMAKTSTGTSSVSVEFEIILIDKPS